MFLVCPGQGAPRTCRCIETDEPPDVRTLVREGREHRAVKSFGVVFFRSGGDGGQGGAAAVAAGVVGVEHVGQVSQ